MNTNDSTYFRETSILKAVSNKAKVMRNALIKVNDIQKETTTKETILGKCDCVIRVNLLQSLSYLCMASHCINFVMSSLGDYLRLS